VEVTVHISAPHSPNGVPRFLKRIKSSVGGTFARMHSGTRTAVGVAWTAVIVAWALVVAVDGATYSDRGHEAYGLTDWWRPGTAAAGQPHHPLVAPLARISGARLALHLHMQGLWHVGLAVQAARPQLSYHSAIRSEAAATAVKAHRRRCRSSGSEPDAK
jgi:hypothetical protein